MTIVTTHASITNDLVHAPATDGMHDPLTLADLDAVSGGGGPVGANPSRNGLRLVTERA